MKWLQRFGLWLAWLGGWSPVAADQRAAAAEAARAVLADAYHRSEKARQVAEDALQTALIEREQAAGALRAYSAPNLAPLLFFRAKQLVAEQAGNHGVSGEAKRHQVYAKLRKEFTQDPHRDIGLAIELALR